MTPDSLLEKVHEAVLDTDDYYVSIDQIRTAIRVTLEEAAKVVEDMEYHWAVDYQDEQHGYMKAGASPSEVIRAMIKEEK